jgi:2-octaprenyl-6-methoxyphenol hydroxylase
MARIATTRRIEADLLIVGGGLVGLTLALGAARAGLASVLVERTKPEAGLKAGFDGRVTSLAWGSHALYRALGLWPALAAEAEPILEIRVADGASPLVLHFDHRDVGERPFGFMVENRHLRRALLAALERTPEVRFLAPARLAEIERGAGGVAARLEGGGTIRTPLLVAADGRTSRLRHDAGIRLLSWRYPQTAIVATLAHELPHHGVAKEHFLNAGPFALLPMTGQRSSMVWTERAALAPRYVGLADAAFAAEVARRAGDHLGRIEAVGPRWSYPLGLQNAERYIDRRLVLVGDAANAMHPIAGQGLNLGLRDVAWLIEVLAGRARLGLDIGQAEVLERYQRRRRWDALTMLLMTDGLNRLFSNDVAPLRLARDLGLGLVQRSGPLKRFFERRAAALAGDLPRLIRGETV